MFFDTPVKKLLQAAKRCDRDAVMRLVEGGLDINAPVDSKGHTPLHKLVLTYHSSGQDIETLLACGADPNKANALGETPLMGAVRNIGSLKVLLAYPGIEKERVDSDGHSAVAWAVGAGKAESLQLLLQAGADPAGWAVMACGNTELECLKLLLQYGGRIPGNDSSVVTDRFNGNTVAKIRAILNDARAGRMEITRICDKGAEEQASSGTEDPPVSQQDSAEVEPQASSIGAVWHVTDDLEISRVSEKAVIGLRVTEIFNFRARQVTKILHRLSDGNDTVLERNFSDVDAHGWLAEAAEAYAAQTGTRPEYGHIVKAKILPE